MNTNEKAVSTAVAVTSDTAHVDTAQARLQELRLMRDLIPRFVIPASPKEITRLNATASVSPEFVELVSVALANHRTLVREGGATPFEIRDLVRYADAYEPFADELEAFAQFVRFSVNAARYKAGVEALLVYAISQRLAKLPETAALAPHVKDMRRALNRGRKASPEAAAKKAATAAAKANAKAAKAAEKVAKAAVKG